MTGSMFISDREQFVFRRIILYYLSVIRQEDVPSLAPRATIEEREEREKSKDRTRTYTLK